MTVFSAITLADVAIDNNAGVAVSLDLGGPTVIGMTVVTVNVWAPIIGGKQLRIYLEAADDDSTFDYRNLFGIGTQNLDGTNRRYIALAITGTTTLNVRRLVVARYIRIGWNWTSSPGAGTDVEFTVTSDVGVAV